MSDFLAVRQKVAYNVGINMSANGRSEDFFLMKANALDHGDLHHIIRFALPVAAENLITQMISMVISMLIGGITKSALAAVGLVNQAVSMYSAIFSLMSTGGAVLLARSIGSRNYKESSMIAEQNMLLALAVSILMSGVSLAAATPVMRLLMPNVEPVMFSEGVIYFRLMMISFPALIVNSVASSMLRAAGNSRGPMLTTVVVNVVQVGAAALFIPGLKMGIAGAGASYVAARYAGAALITFILLKYHSSFKIDLKRMLKPDFPTWTRMARIGVPNSLESTLVQAGYLIANTMIVNLGAHQAAVYQVTNTLYGFAAYPQGICGPILISFVGQALGAGQVAKAKKTLMGIYCCGMVASLIMSLIISLCVVPLGGLFTGDPTVIEDCKTTIWYMFVMCIPAMSINGMDPGLRTGGDSKWIMIYTIFAVWAIRVPLTWLFCYQLSWGVPGLFMANIISLVFRALCSQFRFHTGKWLHANV